MRSAALLLFILLAGCATAPKPHVFDPVARFTTDFDHAWSATIETFAEMNLPIQNMEKASGLVTTDWISFAGDANSGYADCGGTGLAIERDRQGKFNVYVKTVEGSVDVRVTTTYRQMRSLGSSSGWVNCQSTGQLEERIHGMIQQKIAMQKSTATTPHE